MIRGLFLFLAAACAIGTLSSLRADDPLKLLQERAEHTKRPLLYIFTGSDWSKDSRLLQEKIVDSKEMQNQLQRYFVCAAVDFPLHKSLSAAEVQERAALKEKFGVEGFPSVVLAMPSGHYVVVNGDFVKDPKAWVEHLVKEQNKMQLFENTVSHLDTLHLSDEELYKLYLQARKMHAADGAKLVLAAGVKSQKPLFFLQEEYRDACQSGLPDGEKQHIAENIAKVTSPQQAARFVALTEFQQRALQNAPVVLQLQPLEDYLENYGECDEHAAAIKTLIERVNASEDSLEK